MDSSRDTSVSVVQPQSTPYAAATYQLAAVAQPQNSPTYEMIPHRVFVGGFQAGTTEQELRSFFENYGEIREVKVIRNNEGSSKGYGFVTFDTEEEASNVRKLSADKLEFKGRRLNLGPAMRRIGHGSRYAEFAVASPQQAFYQGSGYPYQSVIIPEGYTVAQPQTAYVVMPSSVAPGYQYFSPSFAYSPATPNQQRQFVLPPTPNPTPNTVSYSVHAPAYAPQKTPSPAKTPTSRGVAKTPTRHEAKTPTRHGALGGSAQGSPATVRRSTSQTHEQTNNSLNLNGQQMVADPMTPLTPGLVPGAQQTAFRWPHSSVQQTTPLHPGQYYQPMMSSYQPTTDMTHYSQMFPPAQLYQQQDCFTPELMAAAQVEAGYERHSLKSALDNLKI